MKLEIYVDGSYTTNCSHQTYAAYVAVLDGRAIAAQRGVVTDAELVSMRNVGGELVAATMAIMFTAEYLKHVSDTNAELIIYHDYNGIYEFVKSNNPWQAKKIGSQRYVAAVNALKKRHPNINIEFRKVKAHSGNVYNEYADSIANNVIPRELQKVYLPECRL